MILQSQLFRGDTKLQAAAESDPAHIVPGARGEHVRKIQLALLQVGATLAVDGVYGSTTAAAVLDFKQKRNIINRSYQTKPDNIVGKMTMAALDQEILKRELTPVFLVPVHPIPALAFSPQRGAPLLAFKVASGSLASVGDLRPVPVRPPSAPGPDLRLQVEVIIAQGGVGTIRVLGAKGGTLTRSQFLHFHGRAQNLFAVAKLRGGKNGDTQFEQLDIVDDDTTATFDAVACGETFFEARVSMADEHIQKISETMRLLSLVDKASPRSRPPGDYSVETRIKTGLVSKEGTPLNPLPGRKINVFGEGETDGFEDWSTDIDFCTHLFSLGATAGLGHRPWTADPRRSIRLPDHSVNNICSRGSPMQPVTIDEILRIAAGKCRLTYGEAGGTFQLDRLRKGLKGARVVDEGVWGKQGDGRAIVFELP